MATKRKHIFTPAFRAIRRVIRTIITRAAFEAFILFFVVVRALPRAPPSRIRAVAP
jgi:hypothetical protein